MNLAEQIKADLYQYADPKKAASLAKFLKAVPGGYGEGDSFIGVVVPKQRQVVKLYYKRVSLDDVTDLLQSPVHEHRMTALFILVYKFAAAKTESEQSELGEFYLANIRYVNNWDLVDSSADKILGAYLFSRDREILTRLAVSDNIWEQRIAVIATFYFIKNHQFEDTLKIVDLLLSHRHDLIHKATGWMLREIGQRDLAAEIAYLKKHYQIMPRTMLRYAIEKFTPELRNAFMKGIA
ncbi:MAG: hypothetical protein DDT32_02233 [Syntrophomonadaceae bacterium]|nr:hypothetical protein [Bacillota bacterium]